MNAEAPRRPSGKNWIDKGADVEIFGTNPSSNAFHSDRKYGCINDDESWEGDYTHESPNLHSDLLISSRFDGSPSWWSSEASDPQFSSIARLMAGISSPDFMF